MCMHLMVRTYMHVYVYAPHGPLTNPNPDPGPNPNLDPKEAYP